MSITEIASTGLLRVIALLPEDTARTQAPDWNARAAAIASLHGVGGVPNALVDLPSQAVRPPVRRPKPTPRPPAGKGSGDDRSRAKGNRRPRGDDEVSSTFSSLL